MDPLLIEKAALILQTSKRVLFITGAGISADSGLPTYRGVSGLYTDKETEDGMPIEEAMSGTMLKKKPEIAWKYIKQIAKSCKVGTPNTSHQFIADYEKTHPGSLVLTQNIDGYHQAAGSVNVIPIHGDVYKTLCVKCGKISPLTDEDINSNDVPLCTCGKVRRPAVILFGEMLTVAHLRTLQNYMDEGFDAVFSIGTTSVFPYISMPFTDHVYLGKPAVEINPSITEVSINASLRLPYKAAEAFGEIRKLYDPLNK